MKQAPQEGQKPSIEPLLAPLRLRCGLQVLGRFGQPWSAHIEGEGHPAYNYVAEGQCLLQIAGQTQCLRKGQLLLMPRGPVRTFAHGSDGPCLDLLQHLREQRATGHVAVEFGGAGEQTVIAGGAFGLSGVPQWMLDELLGTHAVVDVFERPELAAQAAALCAALDKSESALVAPRLAEIVYALGLATVAEAQDCLSGWHIGGLDPQIGTALRLMHTQTNRNWGVAGLARASGLSRARFAERFRRLVGVPPMRYLQRLRLGLASQQLLADPEQRLSELAEALGFGSPHTFASAFLRVYGVTPTRYREVHRRSRPAGQSQP